MSVTNIMTERGHIFWCRRGGNPKNPAAASLKYAHKKQFFLSSVQAQKSVTTKKSKPFKLAKANVAKPSHV